MASNSATQYYSVALGSKREYTHEGFLICRDVPVARAGEMKYGPDESPVPVGNKGYAVVTREISVIADPLALQSGVGKTITIKHPDEDVTPENWKDIACGTVLSARMGDESGEPVMLMDIIIQDEAAIHEIESGSKEVSLGYESMYHWDEDRPGFGEQTSMTINHLAIVESGRCGTLCKIKDHAYQSNFKQLIIGVKPMAVNAKAAKPEKKVFSKVLDLLWKAKDAETEEEFKEVLDEAAEITDAGEATDCEKSTVTDADPETGLGASIDTKLAEFEARLKAIEEHLSSGAFRGASPEKEESDTTDDDEELEDFIKEEAPEGKEEEAAKAKDSAYLADSFQSTLAAAELLAPGIKAPVFDRAMAKGKTAENICALRKKALRLASTNDSADIIDRLTRGKSLNTKAMTCDSVRTMFFAAAEMKAAMNAAPVRDSITQPLQAKTGISTPAELNEFNKQKWGKK